MTPTQITILSIYAVIVAIWPIRLIVIEVILRHQRTLSSDSPRYEQPDPPLVSAILPAKDEELNLADCLGSVCRQTYPNLEILVVDDRSTDRTGEIALGFAERDPRVRVLSIEHLPPGWTGKTHALDQALRHARGQWLWFFDADTTHAPESLSIVMEYGRSEGAALVSLLPELTCETFWEKVVQPLAGITLMQSFPLQVVNNDRSRLAFANGQYILIERTAYEAAGGHRAVRDRFVEDIGIAKRVKSLGLPIRVTLVRGLVSCRMYSTFRQLVRGWSRILYDAMARKTWRLALKLLDPIIFCQSGHLALAAGIVLLALGHSGPFGAWLLVLALIHHALMCLLFLRVYTFSVPGTRYFLWYPLGNLVVDVILVRAIHMCLTGNVTWRGTAYQNSGADGRIVTTSDVISRQADAARDS
jgi:glycosyltransferase involved in cell wall biosynthesis